MKKIIKEDWPSLLCAFCILIAILGVTTSLVDSNVNKYDKTPYNTVVNSEPLIATSTGIIIFHREGCNACESIENDVVKFSNKYKEATDNDVLMIETTDYLKHFAKGDEDLITKYEVTKTPTVVKVENGKITEQYTGINLDKWAEIFEIKN